MIRAHVADSWNAHGVNVSIVLKDDEHSRATHILRYREVGEGDEKYLIHQWEPVDPDIGMSRPTFALPYEVATTLLGALHSHFQGVDDRRALRADYDKERGRVDKLTDAVIDLAKGLAQPALPGEYRIGTP
jgi:hypothetical protein